MYHSISGTFSSSSDSPGDEDDDLVWADSGSGRFVDSVGFPESLHADKVRRHVAKIKISVRVLDEGDFIRDSTFS